MKKFLLAVAASAILFGGQTEATPVDNLNANIETQDVGKWAHIRDKYILNRETENERRDRKEWERRHRDDYYRGRYRDDYRHEPPPPPPPPPRYRDGRGYYPPPPPPGHRGDYPPPPPTRRR